MKRKCISKYNLKQIMADISEPAGKRITYKRTRPNPLFQGWLEELHDEAKAKKSKIERLLKTALTSISKYPVPLQSGAECAILKGFDKRLCLFLDKRLEVYNSLLDPPLSQSLQPNKQDNVISKQTSNSSDEDDVVFVSVSPPKPSPSSIEFPVNSSSQNPSDDLQQQGNSQGNISQESQNSDSSTSNKTSKPRGKKTYKPALKSGSYAILIALLESSREGNTNGLTKEALVEKAQKHSEESFIRPKPETFYTAWASMTGLVKKGLVNKIKKNKIHYSLTSQGVELAIQLMNDAAKRPEFMNNQFDFHVESRDTNDELFDQINGNQESTQTLHQESEAVCTQPPVDVQTVLSQEADIIEMAPGTFDIILLIDKNETGGVTKKNDPTMAQFNKYPDLKHEYRSLKVGDFAWIAKHKVHQTQELVLPFIVERKRMDDLGASIKDGRFHEQKFRLRRCGLDNVIYLVENFGSNKHVGLPVQSLMQAIANTRAQDGFKVHITDSLTNSARFLAMMSKRLTFEFKDKILRGGSFQPSNNTLMTYEYFNESSSKRKALTITETFIKILLQLKGMSVEKALAITKEYSTPALLIQAYEGCSQKEGEMLVANLKCGDLARNVGPTISKALYQIFTVMDAR